jgi:2',3'-cyclic-nucleotide 2'-phosphodiesterase (5'-nucleotidase family)
LGGLSKKAFFTKQLGADSRYPALIVNSGNLLFATETLAADSAESAKITAEGVIQASRATGSTLAGVGSLDLSAGLAFLRTQHHPPDFTWLSLNLVDPQTKKPLFAPVTWRQVNGLNIAVLALTDHAAVQGLAHEALALPWEATLKDALATVQGKADVILLLSNYSLTDNKEIARTHEAIDLILQSGHVLGNMTPLVVNKTMITQTEIRGKYVGVLDIDWNGHGRWREAVAASGPALASDDGRASTYSNRFLALTPSVQSDPEVEAVIKQTQRRLGKQSKQTAH